MKKGIPAVLLTAVCLFNAVAFSACTQPQGDETVEPEKMTYWDLYRTQAQKTPAPQGKALYKASYGYTLVSEQGYGGFSYQYRENGAYYDMTYAEEAWQGGGARMQGGVMAASATAEAVRTFRAPVSGNAHVYGNPRLVNGTHAHVQILLGGEVVAEYDLTDAYGVYHSHTLALSAGEEVRFVVSGEGEVYWNPTVDYTLAEETLLHHTVDGYYGDVHPFYDENTGKLYMYYLSTGMQVNDRAERFSSLLTVSDDFIRYTDTPLSMDEENPPEQELYYALGVYVDKEGRYRSSYGKGSYAGGSVSDELLVWQNAAQPYVDEADGLLKYTWRAYFDEGVYSGRDPDICYDAQTDTYYCVVMNYYSSAEAQGEKSLALYMAGADGRFSTKSVRLVDFTGRGDPECPQLKKIGDRWYLFYSVYGTGTAGNVGNLSYRIGDPGVSPDRVDWNSKTEYALEGGDVHAAQLCKVGDFWYMYGWINYTPPTNVWGGHLNLARAVYQREDGTLGTRCDEALTELLNMGRVATFRADNVSADGMTADGTQFTSDREGGTAVLDGTYGRSYIKAELELGQDAADACVTLSQNGVTYRVGVERRSGELFLVIESGSVGCSVPVREADKFSLTVVADGPFLEAYLDGGYTLSSNTRLAGEYTLGITGGKGAKIAADVFKLADYNNIFD